MSIATAAQAATAAPSGQAPGQRILPPGAIQHIMVIDLENESFAKTFQTTPGYLRDVLEPQGELLPNYYATGHVSLDNYIAQVSGQAPNYVGNTDCLDPTTFSGAFNDVVPGTLDADQKTYPGQVDGQGCVYPAVAQTIGDQLDAAAHSPNGHITWREYAEDMGNDASRDNGTVDPLGGTDCAHPVQTNGTGSDGTNGATATDQYATRHNPFMYFHSIIDDPNRCASHVVPLGTVKVGTNGAPDTFAGHLVQDLATPATTPAFSFVTPNLCNDGHDPSTPGGTCAGADTDGNKTGGLTSANAWLAHWMPLILGSPAYRSGHMLVVITADEGSVTDLAAGDNERPGPSNPNPGYSRVLNVPAIQVSPGHYITYYQALGITAFSPSTQFPSTPGLAPGGGRVGALLLNPRYVHVGTVDNSTSTYNHYSALRTYEDLLGLTTGGADGQGHLGFASTATPFGADVFTRTGR